ncbi:MAG: sugar transferase [Anaerolineaceae bacterium]|nr:sugar transferase [Anaerolineaceae bacterium]
MFRRFSANFAVLSIFLDASFAGLALLISADLRTTFNSLSFVKEIDLPTIQLPWMLYLIFPVVCVGMLLLLSVYDGRRNLRVADEFGSLTLGMILSTISNAGILYFTFRDVSRLLFLVFALLTYFFLLIWRGMYRLAFRLDLVGRMQKRRVIILGAGVVGRRLQGQIWHQPHLGLDLIGFLDDSLEKKAIQPDILGSLDEVRKIIIDKSIDDVVLALPLSAHGRLNQIVSELHDMPVRVWVIPDYFSLTLLRASIEDFAGIPMLDLRAPALSEYQRITKRTFDLGCSSLALLVCLPIMGIIALLIRADSRGGAFYRQKRVGENGRLFEMIKFRTMVTDADKMQQFVEKKDVKGRILHKTADDPRVTRIGRLLRRTSLDELPQLINVLKGEMSMVGPRPEMPYLVDKYALWQRKRFAVPQGITGWWQINGRSDKPMHLHTDEDLYYVQHYSIWLDLHIILKTIWVVLRGKGAY